MTTCLILKAARMWRYIFERLLLLMPTLLGILAITFAIIQFVPAGRWSRWASSLLESSVGGETAAAATGTLMQRQPFERDDMAALMRYGFDKPPLERFGDMVSRFAVRFWARLLPPPNRV